MERKSVKREPISYVTLTTIKNVISSMMLLEAYCDHGSWDFIFVLAIYRYLRQFIRINIGLKDIYLIF